MDSMTTLVGFGRVELHFPVGVPLAGFAARTGRSTGTADPLVATAVCVSDDRETSLIVGADLTSLSPTQTDRIRQQIADATGINVTAIAVTVTHTHSAPNVDPSMMLDLADESVIESTVTAIAEAGIAAASQREPATHE